MVLNSQRSTSLSLPHAGKKGMYHHAWADAIIYLCKVKSIIYLHFNDSFKQICDLFELLASPTNVTSHQIHPSLASSLEGARLQETTTKHNKRQKEVQHNKVKALIPRLDSEIQEDEESQ